MRAQYVIVIITIESKNEMYYVYTFKRIGYLCVLQRIHLNKSTPYKYFTGTV